MTLLDNFGGGPVQALQSYKDNYWHVQSYDGRIIASGLTEPQARALADAMNSHDKLRWTFEALANDPVVPPWIATLARTALASDPPASPEVGR